MDAGIDDGNFSTIDRDVLGVFSWLALLRVLVTGTWYALMADGELGWILGLRDVVL